MCIHFHDLKIKGRTLKSLVCVMCRAERKLKLLFGWTTVLLTGFLVWSYSNKAVLQR